MRHRPNPRIRELLESAYRDFHSGYHRERDPIALVHRFTDPRDREVAAFFAALLAYGNVTTILASVGEVLRALGASPYAAAKGWQPGRRLPLFRHRFTTGEDLEIILCWLGQLLRSHGSIEAFFVASRQPLDAPMRLLLSDFVCRLGELPLPGESRKYRTTRGRSLKYLISDPLRGSACKRLNMFLRWMVRPDDGVDLGLWKSLRPEQLVLPVDTHLLQTLRRLGWTRSKQATWKVAEAATEKLRLYEPADPVRYDFALCHLSMSGHRITDYRRKEEVTHAALER